MEESMPSPTDVIVWVEKNGEMVRMITVGAKELMEFLARQVAEADTERLKELSVRYDTLLAHEESILRG
jgi:hypothetical protein